MSGLGGVIAYVSTDSIAVPCSPEGGLVPMPGGNLSLPDGRPAVKLLTPDAVRAATSRLDALLGYDGHPAWKEVAGTLTHPAMGVVFGSNKLVLSRQDDDGAWHVVQSSDADMGGHLVDPTGTGAKTADGRCQWAADLELCLFEAALATPVDRRIAVPDDLPEFAERLALRQRHVGSWTELRQLRRAIGDPTILPLARYVQVETGGRSGSPVALGRHPDPATWPSLDFRLDGDPVCIDVLDRDGALNFAAGDPRAPRHVIGHTIRDHATGWLREQDPSMTGPARGLRRPTPVGTDRSLVHYVGRSIDDLESSTRPVLEFTATVGWLDLRCRASRIGPAEIERLGGPPKQTTSDALRRATDPGPETMALIADAVALARPRTCPVCGDEFYGPLTKEVCSTRCRVRRWRERQRASISESVEALRSSGGAVPADRTWDEREPSWTERSAVEERR
jgi:hypothetical protein